VEKHDYSYELDTLKRVAMANAATVRVNAQTAGMVAENTLRALQQESPAYFLDDFERLIDSEGIGHNPMHELVNG